MIVHPNAIVSNKVIENLVFNNNNVNMKYEN
jgi:hypothetical protein